MCLRLLRAEIWKTDNVNKRLSRVTACIVDDAALSNPVVIAQALRKLPDGTVCATKGKNGPCMLIFAKEDGVWKIGKFWLVFDTINFNQSIQETFMTGGIGDYSPNQVVSLAGGPPPAPDIGPLLEHSFKCLDSRVVCIVQSHFHER